MRNLLLHVFWFDRLYERGVATRTRPGFLRCGMSTVEHWRSESINVRSSQKSSLSPRGPRVLMAVSIPCDEDFQAQHATPTAQFYFQLRGGSGTPLDAVGRIGSLCNRYPGVLNVHLNCFSRRLDHASAEKQFKRLSSCRGVTVSSVPGMKGLFWKHALRPHDTAPYDFIWLADADLDVTDPSFNLARLVRDMRVSNAALAQPRIKELAGGGRSTDIKHLRFTSNFPDNCSAVSTDVVEVMAPFFRSLAWSITHRELLSVLPDELLRRTDWGITQTWCGVVRRLTAGPACALLHEGIVHFDEHLIERAGLDNLTTQSGDWQKSRWEVLVRVPGSQTK